MLKNARNVSTILSNYGSRIKFPEKFKGTIVEKWADYWKNLFIDYRQMVIDLRTDIQDEPLKAIKWTCGLAAAYTLCKNNPDEIDFKDNLKRISNEAILVSNDCLKPSSINHVRYLEHCYNENVLQYKNFGLFSLILLSDFNESCSLYKKQCSYTQPSYFSYYSRIMDVGIMGRWWNLYIKTTNYDINE